jgi:2-formylbenzoate dehydrogenase
MTRHALFVGAALTTVARYEMEDPATGAPPAEVPDCAPEEIDPVVRPAGEAQRAWANSGRRASAQSTSIPAR